MDHHMKAALDEARQGDAEGGTPIGAALVDAEGNPVPPEGTGGSKPAPWSCTGSVVQCSISTAAAGESENFQDHGFGPKGGSRTANSQLFRTGDRWFAEDLRSA